MSTRYFTTLILVLPFLLSLVLAQAPKEGGADDKEWLTPLNAPKRSSTICKNINLRTLSGTCTSSNERTWGSARFPQFSYEAGSSSVRPVSGRPSARQISNIIFAQGKKDTANRQRLNLLFVFFGQFIDHNLVTTPQDPDDELDIKIPVDDDTLSSTDTLHFRRSVRAKVDGGSNERPLNTLSSPFDLVAVYGAFDMRNIRLRGFNDIGSLSDYLKTSRDNLLPLNHDGLVNAPDTSNRFFLAGDHRVNEHPVLTAFHTIFLREHNRLVRLIRDTVGDAPSNLVYNAARAMNIAQFQKIVFEQFYPAAVGKPLPRYRGFQSDVNPTVSDVFSGAAYRVGHTMVSNTVPLRNKDGKALPPIPMLDLFFRPARTFSSGLMDNILRGTAHTIAQEVDAWVVDALRNQLFEDVKGEEGFDLVALNIQRGRDHALPSFNNLRKMFELRRYSFFSDITRDRAVAARISKAYNGKIDDVDAFVGLLAEDHEPGSTFGKTMNAVWEAEFLRLRDGDQFSYLQTERLPNLVRNNFKEWVEKLQRPNGITLADIIVENSAVTREQLPTDIFRAPRRPTPPPTPVTPPARSIRIRVKSAGFDDGNNAIIEVNSKSVFGINSPHPRPVRGLNVAIIDEATGNVVSVRIFDVYRSRGENDKFRELLESIPSGRILVIAVKDEASVNLSQDVKEALVSLGSTRIEDLGFRDSWCFITRVGQQNRNVREALSKRNSGAAEIIWDLGSTSPGPVTPTSSFINVFARSEGFKDGQSAIIEVNSKSVFTAKNGLRSPKRGMNAAIINEQTGKVLSVQNFDTFAMEYENEKFQEFLSDIPKKRILVIAVMDEASRRLDRVSRQLLKNLGSKRIDGLNFRDSWCMITRVGFPNVHLSEAFSKSGSGGAQIRSARLELGLKI